MFITGVNDIGDGTLYRIPVSTAEGTIGTSWIQNQIVEKSASVEKTKVSNSSRDNTVGTSQTLTAKERPSTAGMPEIVEMPTTVLASAGTPTAQY
jgi:hypothetical protein